MEVMTLQVQPLSLNMVMRHLFLLWLVKVSDVSSIHPGETLTERRQKEHVKASPAVCFLKFTN